MLILIFFLGLGHEPSPRLNDAEDGKMGVFLSEPISMVGQDVLVYIGILLLVRDYEARVMELEMTGGNEDGILILELLVPVGRLRPVFLGWKGGGRVASED